MDERTIFTTALEQPDAQARDAYLIEVCGDDAELRARVDDLLALHSGSGEFLERSPLEPGPTERIGGTGRSTPPECDGLHTVVDEDFGEISLDFLSTSGSTDVLGGIGSYEVTELIGRGGMGIVLKARDPKLNRVVAIKVLAPELAGNATARKRFLREAQAAAAVTHQHVVTIHAVDEDRLPYLVMEFVQGQSLQEKIDREGPLALKEVLRVGAQVAAGLAAAHAQGLIHRDIKPANILLENGVERVRITDFGLARAVDDASVTKLGEVHGTPQYMSPEQAQGETVDARSDLFNLGCVLYAMCTGRSPFRADTTVAAIRRVCDETPRPIHDVNQEAPQWLVDIVDRLLEKNPNDRIQTAAEVADLLGQHLAHVQDPDSTSHPEPLRPLRRRSTQWRRRWMVAVVGSLLAVTGLGLLEAAGVIHLMGTVEPTVPMNRETGDLHGITNETQAPPRVTDPGHEVDLLRLIDVHKNSVGGAWRFENDTLVSPGTGRWDRLDILYPPPDEYDLEVTAERRAGDDMLSITLLSGGRQFFVGLDMFEGRLCGLGLIDGKDAFTNETTTERDVFGDRLPHKIVCRVRRDGLGVTVDGESVIDWRGNLDRLSIPEYGGTGHLGLMAMRSEYRFYDVILKRVSAVSDASPAMTEGVSNSPADSVVMPEELRYPTTHSGPVLSIAVSPDGSVIATGSSDNTILLFDRETRTALQELTGDTAYDLKFTSDGRQLLSAGDDGTVRLWDVETGDEIRRFVGHDSWVSSLDLSVDGRTLVTSSHDGTIRVWDFDRATQLHQIDVAGERTKVFSVRFDADGKRFVSAHLDGTVTIWNASTREEIVTIPAHEGMAYVARFSPGGRTLLTTGSDNVACLWDIDSRRRLQTLLHGAIVTEGEFLSDGRFVVTSSGQNILRVWSVDTGREVAVATGLTHCMSSLALLPDEQHLVSAGGLLDAHVKHKKRIWIGDGDYDIRLWRLPVAVGVLDLEAVRSTN